MHSRMAASSSRSNNNNKSDINIELIIEKLSTNGTEKLEPVDALKQLKAYCKSLSAASSKQDEAYKYLGSLVLHQLEKNHAQIRFGSLLIIEYLFERSHQFRVFICEHLNDFFALCLNVKGFKYVALCDEEFDAPNRSDKNQGSKSKKSLLPIEWAKKLRAKAIECFTYWYTEFGRGYPVLPSGFRFLQKHGIIAGPNQATASTSTSFSQSNHQPSIDQSAIQQIQYEKLVKEFEDIESDVNVLITQIDTCFDLLIPKFKVVEDDASNTSDSFRFRPMQGLSFSIILNAKVEITRDSSNSDLIDNLKELCDELNKAYKGKLSKFYNGLNKLKLPLFESNIKELISKVQCLKVKIGTIVWKFNEINIVLPANSSTHRSEQPKDILVQNGEETQEEYEDSDEDDDDFEDVPEREDLCLMRKIQVEKERQLKEAEQALEESVQKVTSETNGHRCRALLPSGRLCPRRDQVKCPFHGTIIPRDHEGLPLDAALRQKELDARFQQKADEWKDPKYLKQLSIETGHDLEGKSAKNKRKKYPNLIDIKKLENTPRKRLMRKISSKRMREKVSSDLSALDEQAHQQYSQQWSYALEN